MSPHVDDDEGAGKIDRAKLDSWIGAIDDASKDREDIEARCGVEEALVRCYWGRWSRQGRGVLVDPLGKIEGCRWCLDLLGDVEVKIEVRQGLVAVEMRGKLARGFGEAETKRAKG